MNLKNSKLQTRFLGEISTVNPRIPDNLPGDTPVSFVPMAALDEFSGTANTSQTRVCHDVVKGFSSFQENDILFAKITPCMENGKVAIAKSLRGGFGFGSTEFHVIRVSNDQTIPEWIYYFLRQEKIRKAAKLRMTGSAGQQRVPKDFLERLSVPVPPLPIQKKIAAILEKADQTRRKRRETICLTDQFLQAAFLEMFGDPIVNPKEWEVISFGKAITNIRYGTGSPPPYQDKGIPFIMATNIKKGTVQDNDIRYISPEASREIAKCQVKAGDLIIVRSGVNAGDCGLIPTKYDGAFAAYDLIVELPYPSAVYYNHLINSPFGKAQLAPLKRRAGQPHLNADQICSLKFPSPPQAEKERFVSAVKKAEDLRKKQHQSEQELETLFQSLMQEAFSGKGLPSSLTSKQ